MPTPAPVTEIGYTQAPNYNWWLYDNETTPELIWPQSVYVYDQMRRQDAQVGSVLRAVTETLLRTPWRIDPAGAKARVTKFVADNLGLPIVGKPAAPPPRMKDRFSWSTHLREALLMLPMGHAYFEQVYRISDDGRFANLRKLAYRPAKTIERIDVASDGGLIAIKQYWTATTREPQPIPVERLVAYIHAKEGGNWLGTSILRNCYKNWLLKDRLLRVQAQTIERNGMGIPLYTAAETEETLTAGLGMATSWRAGEAAGSAVPFGASLRLVGVEGTLPDAMPAVEYHDSQIARAVLAHFLNLGQSTGSWALGTTFADFFTMSLQTLAEQIRDTATQHIVEDLVDLNFGEDEPAPRLVFDEIGSKQASTAAALKTLVDAGILHPDQVLEESSRQQYGLPPADPATATLPPGQQGVTPPEPTQMGDTSPSVAAKAAPKGQAASAADADGRFPPPTTRPRSASRKSRRVEARYNSAQTRDPGGADGGQWTKGPSLPDLDMDGFDLISQADGSFGELALGADEAGDVRFAFHEGHEARALDLAADDIDEMSGALSRLAAARDDLDAGLPSGEIVDDEWFGAGRENKVELLGNGVISVVFGAEDDDPYTLNLDPADGDQDDVQAVLDALGEVQQELDAREPVQAKYNPSQLRDPGGEDGGRWVSGPGGAVKDALKLAERIDLDSREHLISSSRLSDSRGDMDMNFAVIGSPAYQNEVRIGLIPSADSDKWRAANLGGTAIMDADQVRKLHTDLTEAAAAAKKAAAAADKEWKTGTAPKDPVLLGTDAVAEGRIPTDWADLSWNVYLTDDDPTSWQVEISAGDDGDSMAFDPKELAKLLKVLDSIDGELQEQPIEAAAGVDTHPGGEQLKHWWVHGPGAARWSTFTELYDQLRAEIEDMSDDRVKAIAASWYHLRFGIWPGSDANRVKHGKAPRGHVVGPG